MDNQMTGDDFDRFFDLEQASAPYEDFPPVIPAVTEDLIGNGQNVLHEAHEQSVPRGRSRFAAVSG